MTRDELTNLAIEIFTKGKRMGGPGTYVKWKNYRVYFNTPEKSLTIKESKRTLGHLYSHKNTKRMGELLLILHTKYKSYFYGFLGKDSDTSKSY